MNRSFALRASMLTLLAIGSAFGVSHDREDRFRQLEEILPTANVYRTASGAPGHQYWQQRVDYSIDVVLDEEARTLTGEETITYYNNSPDTLSYLWLQLDQNRFASESHAVQTSLGPSVDKPTYSSVGRLLTAKSFDGGSKITEVTDGEGQTLRHTINDTMMRVDLERPLLPGAKQVFSLGWAQNINDHDKLGGRGGYEHFEDDGNDIYEIAQWFPRLCAYTDVNGWQHKQFLGRGEFTLEFGDYDVNITVPGDHIVAATGVLQNSDEVLDDTQRERFEESRTAVKPMFIVTPEEALENEAERASDKKTWSYHAENVRDFAWASSRKFIWDSKGQMVGDREVMAMSYYPKEGEPLWSRYSTHSILHTIEVYSKFTFDYPYPTAISVNGPVGGMEYPMICFNGPRPEEDGTYSSRTKYGLISVIIHEVGHNWFPMIVNSDERQWTWMDEGLNTFLQYLTEQEWEDEYPSWRGEPQRIVDYMVSEDQVPIMTNSESILQFGNNAYAKPATALNILRETVMGRELFDFAFKEYSNRWSFKRPEPADLFRSMEDASAVDLDWFWRSWFYSTGHVDLAIQNVTAYRIDTRNPDVENPIAKEERDDKPETLAVRNNKDLALRIEAFPELADFYNSYDDLDVLVKDREDFTELVDGLEDRQREVLESDFEFYVVDLQNISGMVMPVVLELEYESGKTEEIRIPAEIWKQNSETVSKVLATTEKVVSVTLDPHLETADSDLSNNVFPREIEGKLFKLEKGGRNSGDKKKNPMQKAAKALEDAEADEESEEEGSTED
ncbi:MAG: hypothetical protein ACI8X5_002909 [Planctomycetota bacterium]|jgi:hypothetical protein